MKHRKDRPWTWKDDVKQIKGILSKKLTQADFASVVHHLRRIQKRIRELEEPVT
jgi:hypothetical protein